MRELLLVAAAGAAGALTRYALSDWLAELTGARFPWSTIAINVVGCFLFGLIMHLTSIPENWRLIACTGFLGAMTTFSTFSYETIREAEKGSWSMASANVLICVFVGLAAGWLGIVLARQLVHSPA
jgi:CrcB protein